MEDQAIQVKDPALIDIKERARTRALEKLEQLNLPDVVELEGDLSFLGKRMQAAAEKRVERLREAFGTDLQQVVALAIKCYWHSAWRGAIWMDEARLRGLIADNDYTRGMSTAEGYIETEGGAWTMFSELASVDNAAEVEKFSPLPAPQPTDIELLSALSCHFLYQASARMEAGLPIEALALIHEAYEAECLSQGLNMWNQAADLTKQELMGDATDAARSEMGRAAAAARFQRDPKQQEKRFIRDCWQGWQDEPDRYPSQAAFARDMLQKCEHIVSQKTIEDWCRDWTRSEKT